MIYHRGWRIFYNLLTTWCIPHHLLARGVNILFLVLPLAMLWRRWLGFAFECVHWWECFAYYIWETPTSPWEASTKGMLSLNQCCLFSRWCFLFTEKKIIDCVTQAWSCYAWPLVKLSRSLVWWATWRSFTSKAVARMNILTLWSISFELALKRETC